jgi:hypothetical protein
MGVMPNAEIANLLHLPMPAMQNQMMMNGGMNPQMQAMQQMMNMGGMDGMMMQGMGMGGMQGGQGMGMQQGNIQQGMQRPPPRMSGSSDWALLTGIAMRPNLTGTSGVEGGDEVKQEEGSEMVRIELHCEYAAECNRATEVFLSLIWVEHSVGGE